MLGSAARTGARTRDLGSDQEALCGEKNIKLSSLLGRAGAAMHLIGPRFGALITWYRPDRGHLGGVRVVPLRDHLAM